MNADVETKQETSRRESCSLCEKRVPVSQGKFIVGTVYAAGFPKRRFYCSSCVKKGRERLLFAIALLVILGLLVLIYLPR
jgi:hypothetical protein